jgi:hypothetical protein
MEEKEKLVGNFPTNDKSDKSAVICYSFQLSLTLLVQFLSMDEVYFVNKSASNRTLHLILFYSFCPALRQRLKRSIRHCHCTTMKKYI